MSTTTKNLQDLYAELHHAKIAEKAEDDFRRKQVSKRRFSQRIMNMLPLATILAWIVAYILSAPHTAALFIRITPAPIIANFPLASLAPVVIEGFIFIIAALSTNGRKDYRIAMWGMFSLSVLVNVVGGLVALYEFADVQFYANPFELGWYFLSPFAGILVSYLSVIAGRIIVQFATGEITLEIDPTAQWKGRVKFYALFETFYNAGLKHGATPSRADKYAKTMAAQYCDGEVSIAEDGTILEVQQPIQAVSRTMLTNNPLVSGATAHLSQQSGTVPSVPTVPADFGFAGYASRQNTFLSSEKHQDTSDSSPVPVLSGKVSQKSIMGWIAANPDAWRVITDKEDSKRKKSKALSIALTGTDGAYKTIERAFDSCGIEL